MLRESKGHCEICGKVIIKQRASKKYCPECLKKRIYNRSELLYRKFQDARKKYARNHYLEKPVQVNIGADSGNNHLPEPSKDKLLALIEELNKFTVIDQKKNLARLLK